MVNTWTLDLNIDGLVVDSQSIAEQHIDCVPVNRVTTDISTDVSVDMLVNTPHKIYDLSILWVMLTLLYNNVQ